MGDFDSMKTVYYSPELTVLDIITENGYAASDFSSEQLDDFILSEENW